jgi:hypothetical protein
MQVRINEIETSKKSGSAIIFILNALPVYVIVIRGIYFFSHWIHSFAETTLLM